MISQDITPVGSSSLEKGEVAYCQGDTISAHPGIYLHLSASGKAVCPYCSHIFEKRR